MPFAFIDAIEVVERKIWALAHDSKLDSVTGLNNDQRKLLEVVCADAVWV